MVVFEESKNQEIIYSRLEEDSLSAVMTERSAFNIEDVNNIEELESPVKNIGFRI